MHNNILSDFHKNADEAFILDLHITEVFIVHSNVNTQSNKVNWELLTEYTTALKVDPHCSLASLDDLHGYVAASGHVFEGILKVREGFCKWFELSTETEELLEDYVCEYRLIRTNTFEELH